MGFTRIETGSGGLTRTRRPRTRKAAAAQRGANRNAGLELRPGPPPPFGRACPCRDEICGCHAPFAVALLDLGCREEVQAVTRLVGGRRLGELCKLLADSLVAGVFREGAF